MFFKINVLLLLNNSNIRFYNSEGPEVLPGQAAGCQADVLETLARKQV